MGLSRPRVLVHPLALSPFGAARNCSLKSGWDQTQIERWGCSSVGRAVALQAIGQEFESPQLHQPSPIGLRLGEADSAKDGPERRKFWRASGLAAPKRATRRRACSSVG